MLLKKPLGIFIQSRSLERTAFLRLQILANLGEIRINLLRSSRGMSANGFVPQLGGVTRESKEAVGRRPCAGENVRTVRLIGADLSEALNVPAKYLKD